MGLNYISNAFFNVVLDEIKDFRKSLGKRPQYLLLGTDDFDALRGSRWPDTYEGLLQTTILGLKVIQVYGLRNYIGVS